MTCNFYKDPDAILDYVIDWSDWLTGTETISTSTWIVPSGITEESSSNTTTTATIWLSSGTVPLGYKVVNRIVSSDNREDDRSIFIRIKDK